MTQLINRQYYTELITPFINKNIIKVLTGQRRVGKSCILQQRNYSVKSVIVASKNLCTFAARPFVH